MSGSQAPDPHDSDRTLELKALRPQLDRAKHGVYVNLLKADITSTSPSQNIALSGAYGSGKSSVLVGLSAELEAQGVKAMQVSLTTLNQSERALLDVSGAETLTAALEKDVVKRLLYSAKPSDISRSRFNRISGFRIGPALGLAGVTGALVTGIAATLGADLPLKQVMEAWGWWNWTGPLLDFAAVSGLQGAVKTPAMRPTRTDGTTDGPVDMLSSQPR